MTTTTRQLKASKTPKSHETASQKAGTATHTGSMSPIQTSFRTMPPPKPSACGTIPTPELNTAYRRPASRIHQPHSHSEQVKLVVCMYTSNRARLTGWKNRQP